MGMPPKHTMVGKVFDRAFAFKDAGRLYRDGLLAGAPAELRNSSGAVALEKAFNAGFDLDPTKLLSPPADPVAPPRPPDLADALNKMGSGLRGKSGRGESFLTGPAGALANLKVRKGGLLTGGY